MAAWVVPAVTGAVSVLSALGSKPKRFDAKAARRINDRYRAERPGGYMTSEDEAHTERVRSRGVSSARRSGALASERATRQIRARRLSGASAAALQTEASQIEALGRESAYGAAADTAYGLYGSNRDFEREKLMKAWGGELGAASGDAARSAQQEAGLWNSILSAAPVIASAWGGLPTGPVNGAPLPATSGGASTYNPSAGLPRRSVPMY